MCMCREIYVKSASHHWVEHRRQVSREQGCRREAGVDGVEEGEGTDQKVPKEQAFKELPGVSLHRRAPCVS